MDNHQIQQPPSQLNDSNPASPSRRRQALSAGAHPLLELIVHHPWLVWSGVSVVLLALVAGATISLMHADRGEQEELAPTPVAPDRVATSPEAGGSIPLWLLGAVALSCATGSLLIGRRLSRQSSPPQLRTHKPPSAKGAPTRAASSQRRQQRRRPPRRVSPVGVPVRSVSPTTPISVPAEPVVTVLPPEESYLDRRESDLAEMMDLRKHQTLASILRDF